MAEKTLRQLLEAELRVFFEPFANLPADPADVAVRLAILLERWGFSVDEQELAEVRDAVTAAVAALPASDLAAVVEAVGDAAVGATGDAFEAIASGLLIAYLDERADWMLPTALLLGMATRLDNGAVRVDSTWTLAGEMFDLGRIGERLKHFSVDDIIETLGRLLSGIGVPVRVVGTPPALVPPTIAKDDVSHVALALEVFGLDLPDGVYSGPIAVLFAYGAKGQLPGFALTAGLDRPDLSNFRIAIGGNPWSLEIAPRLPTGAAMLIEDGNSKIEALTSGASEPNRVAVDVSGSRVLDAPLTVRIPAVGTVELTGAGASVEFETLIGGRSTAAIELFVRYEDLTLDGAAAVEPVASLLDAVPKAARVGVRYSTASAINVVFEAKAGKGEGQQDPRVRLETTSGLAVVLDLDGKRKIGPVVVAAAGLELRVPFGYEPQIADPLSLLPRPALDGIGIEGPEALTLSVDAPAIRATGSVVASAEEADFFGQLSVEIVDKLTVAGLAVYTRAIEGRDVSLIVTLGARFPTPIALGWGFFLKGVGGVFGLGRSISEESMISGIRTGALDHILFPGDEPEEPSKIIGDLNTLTPITHAEDLLFGPTAEISWGSATLVTARLGLLVQFSGGEIDSLLLVGQFRIASGQTNNDNRPLRLNFDVAARAEFRGGLRVSALGQLRDSKLGPLKLTGSIYGLLATGPQSAFVLTAGGFNPNFQPAKIAPNIPGLDRISGHLSKGPLKLHVEGYAAIAPGVIMFGGVAFTAISVGAKVEATVGLHAYVRTSPGLFFSAQAVASASLSVLGQKLVSGGIDVTVNGPAPYRVYGRAWGRVFGGEKSYDFDIQFGSPQELPSATADLDEVLLEALGEHGWGLIDPARVPANGFTTGQILDAPTDEAPPFAWVTLTQSAIPLQTRLERVGHRRIAGGANPAWIGRPVSGSEDESIEQTDVVMRTVFRPADFFDESQLEQQQRYAFEDFTCGIAKRWIDDQPERFDDWVDEDGTPLDPNEVSIDDFQATYEVMDAAGLLVEVPAGPSPYPSLSVDYETPVVNPDVEPSEARYQIVRRTPESYVTTKQATTLREALDADDDQTFVRTPLV